MRPLLMLCVFVAVCAYGVLAQGRTEDQISWDKDTYLTDAVGWLRSLRPLYEAYKAAAQAVLDSFYDADGLVTNLRNIRVEARGEGYSDLDDLLGNIVSLARAAASKQNSEMSKATKDVNRLDAVAERFDEIADQLQFTIGNACQNENVVCQTGGDGEMYAFLHPDRMEHLTQEDLDIMFTDKTQVHMVYWMDGASPQRYGDFAQLSHYSATDLRLVKHGSGVRLWFVPDVVRGTLNGLNVNGADISFSNCDTNSNSFIQFQHISDEVSAVGRFYALYNTVLSSLNPSTDFIPEELFFSGALGFGGCGSWTTSNTATDFNGIAIGLKLPQQA